MELVVMIVLTVGIVSVAVVVERKRQAQRQSSWTDAAESLGLRFNGTRISGTMDGVSLTVDRVVRGSGKNKQVFTIWSASLAGTTSMPVELDIVPEHFFRKMGKVVGMQDWQLDLPGIDNKLMVRCPNEQAVRTWARRADIARGLGELAELDLNFHLTDIELKFEGRGDVLERVRMVQTIQTLVRLARCFGGQGIGALTSDGSW